MTNLEWYGLIKWPSDDGGVKSDNIGEALEWVRSGNSIGLKNCSNDLPIDEMNVFIRTNCNMKKNDERFHIFAAAKISKPKRHPPSNWDDDLDKCEWYMQLAEVEELANGFRFPLGSFNPGGPHPWHKTEYAAFKILSQIQLNEILRK